MDTAKKSPTVLSFCTGYGGLEKGLLRAIGGLHILSYVEIEAYAIANMVNKMEHGKMAPAPIWTNLKTFSAIPFRGKTDFVIGSYPCQPFSNAGKRKGSDDPRHLWPHFVKSISECEPGWVFFENVQGHINIGAPEVLRDLEEMGYRCKSGLYSAHEVGAPHERKRLFILGKLEQPNCYGFSRNKKSTEISSGRWPKASIVPRGEWPSSPGQEQKPWEKPRTLANAKGSNDRRVTKESINGQEYEFGEKNGTTKRVGATESGMGGAVAGPSIRVDRIRLLGNGVMPHVSEKAFRELFNRISQDGEK